MKYAIIAVTERGASLAAALQQKLAVPAAVFVKQEQQVLQKDCSAYVRLKDCIEEIFPRYAALIFIGAAGIAVRMIAPHLVHKTVDPAVLVIDEQAKHVISLLSGHIGGANRLTEEIARLLGADPVITTATDVNGQPAADVIAADLEMTLSPLENLKKINGALAAGRPVGFYIDTSLRGKDMYRAALAKRDIAADFMAGSEIDKLPVPCVVLTDKKYPATKAAVLFLQPRRLVLGIGCRRGTTQTEILAAVDTACRKINKTRADIALVASTVVKQKEAGLLAAAAALEVPVCFYDNAALQHMIDVYGLAVSAFVYSQIGIGNVCEAAALYAAKSKKIILPKEKYEKVTVAIAWEK